MGVNASTAFLTMQGAGAVGQAYGAYNSASLANSALNSQADIAGTMAGAARDRAESINRIGAITKDIANTQAKISEVNAELSEFQAEQTILAGQRREQNLRLKGAQLKSTQRATMAANGIDLGSQTPVNILTTTDVMTDLDAKAVALDALRSAWGYKTQAVNFRIEGLSRQAAGIAAESNAIGQSSSLIMDAIGKESQAYGMRTMASATNPWLSGGASLMSSAGSVATNWYMMNKLGMFGDGANSTPQIGGGSGLRMPSLDGDIGLKMPRVNAGYGLRF